MAIATRTDSVLSASFTQLNLYDALKQALADAGYPTPLSEFTSGTDRVVVYQVGFNPDRAVGTAFIRYRVTTTFIIAHQIYSGWNTGTNTGTNGSTEIAFSAIANTNAVSFIALSASPEYRLVLITSGTFYAVLGFISPQEKPNWWDVNAHAYIYIPTATTFALLRTNVLNPYSNNENDTTLNNARMANINLISNRRDILPGVIVLTQSNQGISGKTSDDFVMGCFSGSARFDVVQIPGDTKEYLVINPASGGLALRIT
jgi:hypothetical protein